MLLMTIYSGPICIYEKLHSIHQVEHFAPPVFDIHGCKRWLYRFSVVTGDTSHSYIISLDYSLVKLPKPSISHTIDPNL